MLSLYISEVLSARSSLVFSTTNPSPITFPDLTLSNSLATQIFLVDGSGNIAADSGQAGSSVVVSIGLLSTGAALWSTSSWTLLTNPNGWSGTINPTGAALSALLTAQSQVQLVIQVQITNAAGNVQTWLAMPFNLINNLTPAGGISNIITGSQAIGSGVSQVVMTGLALSATPRLVLVNIQKPLNALNIFGTVIKSSITTDGFTVDLSGQTDSASYLLEYQISF